MLPLNSPSYVDEFPLKCIFSINIHIDIKFKEMHLLSRISQCGIFQWCIKVISGMSFWTRDAGAFHTSRHIVIANLQNPKIEIRETLLLTKWEKTGKFEFKNEGIQEDRRLSKRKINEYETSGLRGSKFTI